MKKADLVRVWGRVLRGQTPFLSLEITKECPLRCPGCYAYSPDHVAPGTTLRQLSDYRGDDLVKGTLAVVRRMRPIHLSIIGGEPLVRYRELNELLPQLDRMGVEVQLVTSAVRPIPEAWREIPSLHMVVSVDGLPAEHNVRRAPATYDRILQHIRGHRMTVHCTVTRPMLAQRGYLTEFSRFWDTQTDVKKIWFSVYTPQEGDASEERLRPEDRPLLAEELTAAARGSRKVELPKMLLDSYLKPPQSPDECTFARLTTCLSADLTTRISPCQLGGKPVCGECGCIASALMHAVSNVKLGGLLPLSAIMNASFAVGGRRRAEPQATGRVAGESASG